MNLDIGPSTSHHLFWLITNFLIFIVIIIGLIILILGVKNTKTLKTGAGPWIISGLIIMLPPVINEILDELNILLQTNYYPENFYQLIDYISPLLLFIGGLLLVVGLYRQFLIGERLSQTMYQKSQELNAQKEELSDFAHTLAHDLRSEISLIIGFTDFLEKKYDASTIKKIRKHVHQINALLNRSIELAEAGLIISKTDFIDLNKLVDEVANVVIPNTIKFSSDNLPTLSGDREKLYQVFKNLFENAVIHGNPETIEVKKISSEKEINILVMNDGDQIPLEDRKRLFQKGFSTKKERSGIGLTIIHRIIEAHDWKISLDPLPETTFRIRIPIQD